MEPRQKHISVLLQACTGQESPGELMHKWSLRDTRAAAKAEPKTPRQGKLCAQCYRGKETRPSKPRNLPHSKSIERFLSPNMGPVLRSMSNRNLARTAWRSPAKGLCSVLQGKRSNSQGTQEGSLSREHRKIPPLRCRA